MRCQGAALLNELMLTKCFEDEKFHTRVEGVRCYLGDRVNRRMRWRERGKILLRNSSPRPSGCAARIVLLRVADAGVWLGSGTSCPFCSEQGRSELGGTRGFDLVFLPREGVGWGGEGWDLGDSRPLA